MDWDNPAYEINKGLLFKEDGRRNPDPDDEALEVFKRGWRYAVYPDDEDFGENAFRDYHGRTWGIDSACSLVRLLKNFKKRCTIGVWNKCVNRDC